MCLCEWKCYCFVNTSAKASLLTKSDTRKIAFQLYFNTAYMEVTFNLGIHLIWLLIVEPE